MIKIKDLLPVCGLVATLIYGWSLFRFIWILPSWLKFLTGEEILYILFLSFAFCFVDSLIFIFLLIVFALLVPYKWFRDDFIFRGSLVALSALIFVIYLASNMISLDGLPSRLAGFLVFMVLFQLLGARLGWLRSLIATIADRSIVFIYIFLPLTLVGILGIFLRNVW
jgi:hypothetical protein